MTSKGLILFDCDGTLVDSQHLIIEAYQLAAKAVGFDSPDVADIRATIGLSMERSIAELFPKADDTAPFLDAYRQVYHTWRATQVLEPLYDGIETILDTLHGQGWTLGVATGKSMRGLEHVLAGHGIRSKFVTLQTADIARSKPDPDMVERAMLETHIQTPEKVIVIGDTSYDMEMARRARVGSIGVLWGYHSEEDLKQAGAMQIASNVADIPSLIAKLSP